MELNPEQRTVLAERRVPRIHDKVVKFMAAREVISMGLYPYFRAIDSDQDTIVKIGGKKILMMGSNNYLGLTNHPEVKKAAIEAIRRFGTGCAGSRFLNGTLRIHLELEEKLAEFMHKEAVLLYSTGFQVNQGVLATLMGRSSYIITDKLDHASIIDGARLSFAKMVKFEHNDMKDLERVLESLANQAKLIVTEGVFSMDGDIATLPDIVKLAEKYEADVMVDDAHSIGVLGPNGDGTAAHFGLTDKVELIMGTFSKSLASVGGFVASSEDVIHYLKHHSRALIFSASPPPASVASVLKALEILQREPERREKLWENAEHFHQGLKALGFNTGESETPIIPVVIGDDLQVFRLCHRLQEEGIFVNPVVSPAVNPGQALIRFSLMSTHQDHQIDFALEKLEKVGKELNII
jgi:8-amino-7-oxononanoate synthase